MPTFAGGLAAAFTGGVRDSVEFGLVESDLRPVLCSEDRVLAVPDAPLLLVAAEPVALPWWTVAGVCGVGCHEAVMWPRPPLVSDQSPKVMPSPWLDIFPELTADQPGLPA